MLSERPCKLQLPCWQIFKYWAVTPLVFCLWKASFSILFLTKPKVIPYNPATLVCDPLASDNFYLVGHSQYFKNHSTKQNVQLSSIQLLSRVRIFVTTRTTAGLPVHHHLLEFTQTHVHWVSDAIQSSHPLLSPSPPAFNLSQHQGLF